MRFNFIVGAIFLTCTVGALLGFMFTSGIRKKIARIIYTIIIAIGIGCAISGMMVLEEHTDIEQWNNGYCVNCGHEYKFANAEHRKNSGTIYYWYCDDCGKVIELHRNFK